MISQYADVGLARWMRVQWLLDHDDGSSSTVAVVREVVNQSPDVPPEIE
jgi:hypothetical protein